jgi:membrane associated rhomboid family serine protease
LTTGVGACGAGADRLRQTVRVSDWLRLDDRPRSRDEKLRDAAQGVLLLAALVGFMWLIEAINTIDSNRLDADGIYARNVSRFWGILTSPFIHASFQHLLDNSVPFIFLGLMIAIRGAARLAIVTAFVIVVGGLGTWLISPSANHLDTIGASGVVFGYATYLLTRGFFDRSVVELVIGAVVGVIWGAVLLASLVPHQGVSWQAHLCGAIAGVIVAWRLAQYDRRPSDRSGQLAQTTAR